MCWRSGGIQTLGEDDKAGIEQTIDEEVLMGTAIEFRSTSVEGGRVEGLELAGERHPISFEFAAEQGGRFAGSATVKQSDWGEAVHGAVRDAQGRGRGRHRVRDALIAVHGLRVKAALHSRRQGARSVGIQGVGDRLRVRAVARPTNAPLSQVRVSGGAASATPASSCALSRILPGTNNRGLRAGGRACVEAVTFPEAVGVGRNDLDVERWDAELRCDELRVLPLRCRRARWSG